MHGQQSSRSLGVKRLPKKPQVHDGHRINLDIMDRKDLQNISRVREKEAKILLENHCFLGAYYLLGYAVECAIKSCIAKKIRRYEFPNRQLANDVYTHDLNALIGHAGLRSALDAERAANNIFGINWNITKDWKESFRYETHMPETTVRDFFSGVISRRNGVLPWLRRRW
jgi:hypothetical protein